MKIRWTRLAVLVGLATLALLLAQWARQDDSPEDAAADGDAAATDLEAAESEEQDESADDPGPAADRWPRTEAGARSAAVEMLELTEEAFRHSPEDAAALFEDVASADVAEAMAAATEQSMTTLLETTPGGMELRAAPIEARSERTDDGWQVAIWHIQVISVPDTDSVAAAWRTTTYDLVWEDDTWKLAATTTVDGPHPAPETADGAAAVTAIELQGHLTGYSDAGLGPAGG